MSVGLGGASFQVRADVGQFQAGMKRAKEEAVRTSQQVGAAVQTISAQTTTGLTAATRSIENTNKAFKQLGTTVGGSKGGHLGLGLLAIGQMVDDMQYGFRSIVNNIPQVTYLMGGSAGLAGGVGIAAVGLNLLISRWDDLMDAMQSRWLNVAASDLEKLRIATAKAGEEFDALMKTPSELGAREISKLKEAITDLQRGGGAGLFKGIAEAVGNEPGMKAEETPAELKQRQFLEGQIKNPPNWLGAGPQLVEDLKKQLAAMDKHLNERNGEIARALIGRALGPGEEGQGARAALKRLVEKFPGAFTPAFRAALQRNTPEMIQGELDLENAKKARERARGVAGQLLGSPLGTQVMLGGAGGGLGADAITKMMGGPMARRLGARGLGGAAGQMEGMTDEQVRGVLGMMDIRKMYELGKARSKELGIPLGNMGQVDPRVLDEVYKKQFAEAMKANKNKPGGLENAVGKALKGAGVIGQDPGEVLGEMRAQLADRRKQLMLERGLTAKQAEAEILREQQQRAFGDQRRPAQWVSAIQLAKMSAVNALSGAGDIPKRSLDELIAIRKALAMMRGQRMMAAIAAGPE